MSRPRLSHYLPFAEEGGPIRVNLAGDPEITGISDDSRKVKPGDLFVCVPKSASITQDSHAFIPNAIAAGAVAVLLHSDDGLQYVLNFPYIELLNFRNQLWRICREFTHNPSDNLKLYGVTGTNGKTTIAWLLRDALKKLGESSAYLGTLGIRSDSYNQDLNNTTPFAVELYNCLANIRESGASALAMEFSSHALAQQRADGLQLDAAIFTNLTQDHLDYHVTMEDYAEAKWRLFGEFLAHSTKPDPIAVFNGDDLIGVKWAQRYKGRSIVFTRGRGETDLSEFSSNVLRGEILELGLLKTKINIIYGNHRATLEYNLGGIFNVENMLAAAAALIGHYPFDQVIEALRQARAVPGRLEPVPNNLNRTVLVDYAHTPDALEKVLESIAAVASGPITTVFGCGGDRDNSKRPKMARAAASNSDLTIITSDNPRTEPISKILSDLEAGFLPNQRYVKIEDRTEAIHFAIQNSLPGGVVLIAGKGHETYQMIGKEKFHYDDREQAAIALEQLERESGAKA